MKKINLYFALLSFIAALSFVPELGAQVEPAIYSYDACNRLTQVIYPNNRKVTFTYDNNGNLSGVDKSGGVNTGPVINTQPVYRPVDIGGTLTLSVNATNAASYQWQIYRNGAWENLNNGGTVTGADTASLTISSLAAADEGQYRCVVNDGSNPDVSSDIINVYVLAAGTTDLWSSETYIAPGSRFSIYDFEVPYLTGTFNARPTLLKGELVLPVNGVTKTYALLLLSAPTLLNKLDDIQCQWSTAVPLYKKTSLASSYASGFNCADFLASNPQYDTGTYIVIQMAGGKPIYLSRFFSLVTPEISDVQDRDETGTITSAPKNTTMTVFGNYFGKKAPIVWMEYRLLGKFAVMKLLLKVLTPLEYPNEKGAPGLSCMDVDSGESKIKVLIPATLPAGIIKGDNNIVIDNGQGLATFTFSLQ
ncbi:MAG: immunoglobulin domain-containing protein [Victivallales bacterium]